MRRLLLGVCAAGLIPCAAARAADPIMPLDQVTPGLRCTGLSVISGTAISGFDVDVLDVLDASRPETARIVVRVSGPAIDATGLGPGFSGSPIYCPGPDGAARNVGAISETIGEFGGKTALATPIAAMLAQAIQPPASPRSRSSGLRGTARARFPSARSLASPLTIGGLSPRLSAAFTAAARRAHRTLIAAPAPTAGGSAPFPVQPLLPGSAVFAGLASGDVSLGAIGTATYVDGGDAWLFGHQLDGAGRRSLFLQAARVSTVINNPIGLAELSTYKLASPGADLGTITGDGPSAVTGRLGALPDSYPLRVTVRDRDTGRISSLSARIADEGMVAQPAGTGSLSLVGGGAVAQAITNVLSGAPAREQGDMCVAFALRERRAPLRFCNRYTVPGPVPNGLAGVALGDMDAAAALIESFRFGTLHPTGVNVGVRVRRGADQAFLEGASAPHSVRRGQRITVRLRLRHTSTGALTSRTIRVRVRHDAPAGARTWRIAGAPSDEGRDPTESDGDGVEVLFDDPGAVDNEDPGPRSLAELGGAFSALGRRTGVRMSFGGGQPLRQVFEDPRLRISGRTGIEVTVLR